MQTIFAKRALTPAGWMQDALISISNGSIAEVTTGAAPSEADTQVDTLLPALANLHSHSFQRAMAGMTEFRASGQDSFWTWRSLMYRFLDHLTPDQIEAIAALVFLEMQEAGYAAVGEFHYVHHQPGGQPYDTLTELSDRIFAAATQSGIGLTHLPVLYTYGGANMAPLSGGQLRFGNSVDRFADLVTQSRARADTDLPSDARVGIAPHSLRATCPEDLQNVLHLAQGGPVHIHIAEQPKEVEDIRNWLGARPVEWLLGEAPVDDKWCLIHATHMTPDETMAMAQSGAIAGLCPITEANLGDGIFDAVRFLDYGGRFGVGSDSNVCIALGEELRMLEYSQRLRDLGRNRLATPDRSTGETLYLGAARGGAAALGRDAGRIEVGALADLVAVDSMHPNLCALADNQLLDGLCFATSGNTVTDLWSAGRHQVRQGRHTARDEIVPKYRKAVTELLAAL